VTAVHKDFEELFEYLSRRPGTPRPRKEVDEGGYVVTCPLLPELITEGETVPEALRNANDALEVVIEAYEDLGRPLPPALRPPQDITPVWFGSRATGTRPWLPPVTRRTVAS
jgi:antitoxin HicB